MDSVWERAWCDPTRIVAERRAWNSTVFLVVLSVAWINDTSGAGWTNPAYSGCKSYDLPYAKYTPWQWTDVYQESQNHYWVMDGEGFHFIGQPPGRLAFFLGRPAVPRTRKGTRISLYNHAADPATQCAVQEA